MLDRSTGRRAVLASGVAASLFSSGVAASLFATSRPARASAPGIRLLTNWYAQAEHGGFYQAKATGLYDRAGVDVAVEMGGPQMNNAQLLLAGRCDVIISGAEQVLKGIQNGLPLVGIATSFQKSLVGLMTHPAITDLAQLKGHPILVSAGERSGFWPWLSRKYGLSDAQVAPYTFNLQPFLFNPAMAIQAYATSEPYAAGKNGIPYRFFLLADLGYASFGNMLVTTREVLAGRKDALARFLGASTQGWHSFLTGDASPATAAILAANPNMTADQIAWSIQALNRIQALGPPGAPIGRMQAAQWARIRQIAVADGFIPAALPWQDGYSLELDPAMTATV